MKTPEQLRDMLKSQLQSAEKDVKEHGAQMLYVDVRDQIASDLEVVEDFIDVSKRLKTY